LTKDQIIVELEDEIKVLKELIRLKDEIIQSLSIRPLPFPAYNPFEEPDNHNHSTHTIKPYNPNNDPFKPSSTTAVPLPSETEIVYINK
jgi:hypothetical protein